MSLPVLNTKLYVPPPQHMAVTRPRLTEQLTLGLHRRLTLISAPAGFGKTTLVSEWIAGLDRPSAWVSLDRGDSDVTRFLSYFALAVQGVAPGFGEGVLELLRLSQPPPNDTILTTLINELSVLPNNVVVVLDDYHEVDSRAVDQALEFLLDNLPRQLHIAMTTREDPQLPLARLRARGQIIELRAADLRFTASEAAEFLNSSMGLNLSVMDINALEHRTEGWIAGLQLAAISMQGQSDSSSFIQSFTGSHRFVMDYLVEEVLNQQSDRVQQFLIQTSILDRMCGPLCDAVVLDSPESGQATLEYIERTNLFLVPLDNERRWYRYHHLFAELLRQRLGATSSDDDDPGAVLHVRASGWFERNGFELDAFRHATAANDLALAERLIEAHGKPLQFRGAGAPVLTWLESLPNTTLDSRPSLWVTYASTLMFGGRHTGVEANLKAAELALNGLEANDKNNDLIGRIASLRATLGIVYNDLESIFAQSRRALDHLHPDNFLARTATTYTLGYAHQLQGDRAEAVRAFSEVIATGTSTGDSIYHIAANIGLAQVQQLDIQMHQAAATFERVIELAGDPPQPIAAVAFLGLGQIHCQWNDLDAARAHAERCRILTFQMESLTTFSSHAVLLAQIDLAENDVLAAVTRLDEAESFVRQHQFLFQLPEIAVVQVQCLLRQGNLEAASHLAEIHNLTLSRASVLLAQGNSAAALRVLEPFLEQAVSGNRRDDHLSTLVLQSLAHEAIGDVDCAVHILSEALALAAPGGFVRLFVNEGPSMAHLLTAALERHIRPTYTSTLLAAFDAGSTPEPHGLRGQSLVDPLSQRELEVLHLIAQGLSNHEIGDRLYLALSTVKGHNRLIFGKLGVQRRTEAVAQARSLGLL